MGDRGRLPISVLAQALPPDDRRPRFDRRQLDRHDCLGRAAHSSRSSGEAVDRRFAGVRRAAVAAVLSAALAATAGLFTAQVGDRWRRYWPRSVRRRWLGTVVLVVFGVIAWSLSGPRSQASSRQREVPDADGVVLVMATSTGGTGRHALAMARGRERPVSR